MTRRDWRVILGNVADGRMEMDTRTKLAEALRACVGASTPAEMAATVDGAANLTAADWIARAVGTLRENDTDDNPLPDMIGDVLDDLTRALKRMEPARAALAEHDAAKDHVAEPLAAAREVIRAHRGACDNGNRDDQILDGAIHGLRAALAAHDASVTP